MPSVKDWKVGDAAIVTNKNFGGVVTTKITRVGHKYIYAKGERFDPQHYPCSSSDGYGWATLYRPDDYRFRQRRDAFKSTVRDLVSRIGYDTPSETFDEILEATAVAITRASSDGGK